MNDSAPKGPPGVNAAAWELAQSLHRLASRPQVASVLRGLEAALPEAAAEVRAALDDPGAVIAGAFAKTMEGGRAELADADRTIAAGLARAFGKGIAKGIGKTPR